MIDQRLMPYYATRALISLLLGFWAAIALQTWLGGLFIGLLLFAGFLWYAHSGWYQLNPTTPLFPLRRDERGQGIRDQALVAAVAVGGVVFALASVLALVTAPEVNAGILALLSAIGCYAVVTLWRFLSG